MKRYKVYWTEKHSAYVEAKDNEEAMDKAMREDMTDSCDQQSIDRCDCIETLPEVDDMDAPEVFERGA